MSASNIGTLIPLPFETVAEIGFNYILRLTYLDVMQLTSAVKQALFPPNALGAASDNFPAGFVVESIVPNVVIPFTSSGGTIAALSLSVGDDGNTFRYNVVNCKLAGFSQSDYFGPYVYVVPDTVDGIFTIAGQTMASLNAGQLDLYLKVRDTSELVTVLQPSAFL